MTAVVTVENINKTYGTFLALNQVSLEIQQGEVLALIGPNGAGKTSLIEIIEGLRQENSGSVRVFGRNPSKSRREIYQKIGLQLQEVAYPDKLKVGEICQWFNALYGNQSDVTSLLQTFKLDKSAANYIQDLSGGQKQKLAILLALLSKPKLLLLDELTTGMDPSAKHEMWQLFLKLKEQETTILIISHYMDEVEFLADRVAYLNAGQLLFCDSVEAFADFVHSQLPSSIIHPQATLEELFLMLNSTISEVNG